MKLSANTMGMFVFTAIATTAFVWMAKRPVIEGDIVHFGVSSQSSSAEATTPKETLKLVEEPKEDAVVDEGTTPDEANSEKVTDEAETASEVTEEKKTKK